jgi:hypothetical protein
LIAIILRFVYNKSIMENTTDHLLSPLEVKQRQVATAVSFVANPLFVATPTFLVVALYSAPNPLQALVWWAVTVAGMTVAPLVFIARGVRAGRYTDHHVSQRSQRLVPLLFGVACFFGVFVSLLLLRASPVMLATVLASLMALAIATGVTQYWKISLHVVGITGTATILTLLFGIVAGIVYPLVLIVAWARWRVRAHTPLQALAGTLLAVSVTVLTFWFFGLL